MISFETKSGNHFKEQPQRIEGGFSLIELLVVIAIVSVLASLAVISFRNIGRGTGVRGAVDLAAGVALTARIEAMSYGYGSILVIDNGNDTSQKLQRLAVLRAYQETNGNIAYELVGKPSFLPEGSYLLPAYSKGLSTTNLTNLPGSNNTPAFFLKFNGSGHLDSSTETRLVFSGNIMDSSGNLQNPESMIQGRRGFILRNNGRPAFFQTPEQMPINP